MNDWISINEMMPDMYSDVLVYDTELKRVIYSYLDDENQFVRGDDDSFDQLKNVTHWMPFPEPPK